MYQVKLLDMCICCVTLSHVNFGIQCYVISDVASVSDVIVARIVFSVIEKCRYEPDATHSVVYQPRNNFASGDDDMGDVITSHHFTTSHEFLV